MRKIRSTFIVFLLLLALLFTSLPVMSQAESASKVIQIQCGEQSTLVNNSLTCLFSNGSVMFFPDESGFYRRRFYNTNKFTDVTMIAMGGAFLAGLKNDGTVVVDGRDIPVESLRDVVGIRTNYDYLYAITKDGTVYRANSAFNQYSWEGELIDTFEKKLEKIENLKPAVDFAPDTDSQTGIAIHQDGTVTVVNDDSGKYSDCSTWKDIKQVFIGDRHVAGLKKDGTVVAIGKNDNNQLDVGGWKDVVQVTVTYDKTIGLKKDGTLVMAGGEVPKEFSGKKCIQIDSNGDVYKALTADGDVLSSGNKLNGWQDFRAYAGEYGDHTVISSWAKESVQQAIERNIVTNQILSMYKKDITREEVCEIALKLYQALSGKEAGEPEEWPFTDTSNEDIIKAYNLKIVNGIGNDQFGPELKVTREQIAVMFYNTIKAALPNEDITPKTTLSFSDAGSVSSWAVTALTYMNEKGIITGVGGNLLSPAGNATREQAIVMINRVYNLFR